MKFDDNWTTRSELTMHHNEVAYNSLKSLHNVSFTCHTVKMIYSILCTNAISHMSQCETVQFYHGMKCLLFL